MIQILEFSYVNVRALQAAINERQDELWGVVKAFGGNKWKWQCCAGALGRCAESPGTSGAAGEAQGAGEERGEMGTKEEQARRRRVIASKNIPWEMEHEELHRTGVLF